MSQPGKTQTTWEAGGSPSKGSDPVTGQAVQDLKLKGRDRKACWVGVAVAALAIIGAVVGVVSVFMGQSDSPAALAAPLPPSQSPLIGSPPPPAPAPPGSELIQQHLVSTSFTAHGNVEDYPASRRDAIAAVIAAAAGVAAEQVTVRVSPASIKVSVDIVVGDEATALSTALRLVDKSHVDGIFATVANLTAALTDGVPGIQIEAIEAPTAAMVTVLAPSPAPTVAPSPTASPTPPPGTPPPVTPPTSPPAVPDYIYPAVVGPGRVLLPQSEPGVLITLSLLASDSAYGVPVGRSYDSEAWEERAEHRIPITQLADGAPQELLLPALDPGRHYRLDRYALAEGGSATQRLAARLLMQATFGPTPDELRNGTLAHDGGHAAASAWVDAQMGLPPSFHRGHFRKRSSPRLMRGQRTPFLENQPACERGSTWDTFTFTMYDQMRILTVTDLVSQAGLGYRLSVDGRVRTDAHYSGIDANYTMATQGQCTGLLARISSAEECKTAALALGQMWDGYGSSANAQPYAIDDGRGVHPELGGASKGPRGCYMEGRPPLPHHKGLWVNYRVLKFNVNDTNTGSCNLFDVCICKRVDLAAAGTQAVPPSPSLPPRSPPPPSLPPDTDFNATDPSSCKAAHCCVVIYKYEPGSQCEPVPIWDLTNWVHPGGSHLVQGSSLCGKVRYNWMDKNRIGAQHGSCDAGQNCDPEANLWTMPLVGGGVRVGTYADPSPACVGPAAMIRFRICDVIEGIGGSVKLVHETEPCTSSAAFFLRNPSIRLDDTPPTPGLVVQTVAESAVSMQPVASAAAADQYVLDRLDAPCQLSSQRVAYLRVMPSSSGPAVWYRLNKRLRFRSNEIATPCAGINASDGTSYDGITEGCPAMHRTPVNSNGCVRRASSAPPAFEPTLFELNATSLRAYFELAGTLAYRVHNLRLSGNDPSPCDPGVSRWRRLDGGTACAATLGAGSDTPLDSATREAIEAALAASSDANEYIKDIDVTATLSSLGTAGSCTSSLDGVEARGSQLTINGRCWRHVHSSEGNVYSFSYWAVHHEGNDRFEVSDNPIMRWASAGLTHIELPASHSMTARWHATASKIPNRYLQYMGRFGDLVDFASLPDGAKPQEMATWLHATPKAAEPVQACGSRGEVASDPWLGHRYQTMLGPEEKAKDERLYPMDDKGAKQAVWTTVVLSARDQLRQRVAWAVSQVLVIGEEGLGMEDEQEPWLKYYDIFVQHAFGSFYEVLWEVTHSPMMSKYLTFYNNRALHVAGTNADENFAREIMQLFSIGLWVLRSDGTYETDALGRLVPTYDNDDIMAFARVMTGYLRQNSRNNAENDAGVCDTQGYCTNFLDESFLDVWNRDYYPKMDLHDRYLGDRYPLCTDLPPRAFLRRGASFRFLGYSTGDWPMGLPHPYKDGMQHSAYPRYAGKDPYRDDFYSHNHGKTYKGWVNRTQWQGTPNNDEPRLVLNSSSSALYAHLCGGLTVSGDCTFPLEVTLDANLPCDADECDVDTARTVQLVGPNGQTVDYEYVRLPCVELTWFDNAVMVANKGTALCADPQMIDAGAACCPSSSSKIAHHQCKYLAERVTHAAAAQRCAALGGSWTLCERFTKRGAEGCGFASSDDARSLMFVWTRTACSMYVQVQSEPAGWVSVVHQPTPTSLAGKKQFRPHTPNTFPVRWEGGRHPDPADGCAGTAGLCTLDEDQVTQHKTCMCQAVVNITAVFSTSTAEPLPSTVAIIERLAIGSVPPDTFDSDSYAQCVTAACLAAAPAVVAYLSTSSGSPSNSFDQSTIFRVTVNGSATYLANKESVLSMGEFTFRNPPHFVSFLEPTERDARNEMDALLRHLVYHPNTAPFIVYRLIQRLVTSNPSPRYVSVAVEAFRTGTYDGRHYSGAYGDLGATVAAILLDREARSPTLDLDPTAQGLREPLVKLLHLMRSLGFRSKDAREVELREVGVRIGQMAYQSPSVFNFYLPEFQSNGPVLESEVYAPEAMLGTAPWIIGFMNGVNSLIQYGLTSCYEGFGSTHSKGKTVLGPGYPAQSSSKYCDRPSEYYLDPPRLGALDRTSADAELTYTPHDASNASEVVSELAMLLTADRLSAPSRELIEAEYLRALNGSTSEYFVAFFTNCSHFGGADIETMEECEAAAVQLQGSNGIDDITAQDDNRNNHRLRPRGCYYESNKLKFNVAGSNYGTCSTSYDCLCKRAGEQHALHRAQELMVMAPEFHATNYPSPLSEPRAPPPNTASHGRPFKALIVLYLKGGSDSWNLLVPRDGCKPGNFSTNHDQYKQVRGIVALDKEHLLPIQVPASAQAYNVCSTFGVHSSLPIVHELYNASQAAFFANTGVLVQPTTKQAYNDKAVELPTGLFAHNIQVRSSQSLDAQNHMAKGVMGRIFQALVEPPPIFTEVPADYAPEAASSPPASPPPATPSAPPPYRTGSYSFAGITKILDGPLPASILNSQGAVRFSEYPKLKQQVANLTSAKLGSVFAETMSQMIETSIESSERLGKVLETVSLDSTRWTDTNGDGVVDSSDNAAPHKCAAICESFEQIARVIASHAELDEERMLLYAELGGFDTHSSAKEQVQSKFEQINVAITALVDELKVRNLWDNVTLLTSSDFGRTLDSNGAGTDHGWAGNYVILGGNVRGGTIHGEYPTSLLPTSDVYAGRGRLLPTRSWESVWKGVAEWMDVPLAMIGQVLPNAVNFPSHELFSKEELFDG